MLCLLLCQVLCKWLICFCWTLLIFPNRIFGIFANAISETSKCKQCIFHLNLSSMQLYFLHVMFQSACFFQSGIKTFHFFCEVDWQWSCVCGACLLVCVVCVCFLVWYWLPSSVQLRSTVFGKVLHAKQVCTRILCGCTLPSDVPPVSPSLELVKLLDALQLQPHRQLSSRVLLVQCVSPDDVFCFHILIVCYLCHWCSYPLPNASLVTSIYPMTLNAPGFLLLVLCIFIDLSFWMVTLVFDSLDRGFISCWNSSLLLYIRNLFCYTIKFLTSETAGCVTLTEPGPSRHPSSTPAKKNIGVI